jgi:hypothetical protein
MKRLLLLLPLLLAGCRGPDVYLAPGVPFRILAAEEGPELFASQEVLFRLPDGRQETALAALENKGGRLSLVASTPMGQTLLVVTVTGSDAKADARIPIPGDLDPRTLAALVQLCLWPADAVRKGLTNPATSLEEAGATRTLLRKGKPVWIITREGEAPPYRRVVLENPSMRLRVQIRTLEE